MTASTMRQFAKFTDLMDGCLEWQTKYRYVCRPKKRRKQLLKAARRLVKAGFLVSDLELFDRITEKRDEDVCVRWDEAMSRTPFLDHLKANDAGVRS